MTDTTRVRTLPVVIPEALLQVNNYRKSNCDRYREVNNLHPMRGRHTRKRGHHFDYVGMRNVKSLDNNC